MILDTGAESEWDRLMTDNNDSVKPVQESLNVDLRPCSRFKIIDLIAVKSLFFCYIERQQNFIRCSLTGLKSIK